MGHELRRRKRFRFNLVPRPDRATQVIVMVGTHQATLKLQQYVATTRRSDTSLRVIFVKIFLCNIILSQQHVAKNQIRQNLCDLLWRQNSIVETKIFKTFLQDTPSDLSLRCVAATCCCNQSPDLYTGVICRRDVLLQLVAQYVPTLSGLEPSAIWTNPDKLDRSHPKSAKTD